MARWTYSERVELFLELADQIDTLRLSRTGIDLSANFHWSIGQETSATIAGVDSDDFRSFIAAWRQLVMRDEPTHLPTILALSAEHLAHPVLRDFAAQLRDHVGKVNRNDFTGGMVTTFAAGDHEYTPWEVADLIMHGSILHSGDRAKRKVLRDIDPWMRTMVEHTFRTYVVQITEAMENTRLILLKAKESGAISDEPIQMEG